MRPTNFEQAIKFIRGIDPDQVHIFSIAKRADNPYSKSYCYIKIHRSDGAIFKKTISKKVFNQLKEAGKNVCEVDAFGRCSYPNKKTVIYANK